jgi:hypothetical protein
MPELDKYLDHWTSGKLSEEELELEKAEILELLADE